MGPDDGTPGRRPGPGSPAVPARRVGGTDRDGRGSGHSSELSSELLSLLAELAEAEGDPVEAGHWRSRAGG